MSEKTEKATPYKLKKNQAEGKVSKSNEIITSVSLLVMLALIMGLWPSVLHHLKQSVMRLLPLGPHFNFSTQHIMRLQDLLLAELLSLWLPFALATIITIILCTTVQTGFVFSFTPIKPDIQRLNIIRGFKRLFALKLLFDTGKHTLKFACVALLIGLNLKYQLPFFLSLMTQPPVNAFLLFMKSLGYLLSELTALLLAIALIDKGYTRWKFAKDTRMTKQEVKDEYRQREGDPKIKLKIKQLHQLQRLKAAAFEHIKTADVIVTNPTHLAIVLKYDKARMPAPKVIYKIQGEGVALVKKIAARFHIPIIENKLLARRLFVESEMNQFIKREHFPMVAQVYKTLYRERESAPC